MPKWVKQHGSRKGPFPSLRTVGVEIECEGGNIDFWERKPYETLQKKMPKGVVITEDGSVDGVEAITPPASGNKLEEIIRKTVKVLKNNEFYIESSDPGLHVHIEYSKDSKKLMKLYNTIISIEDIIFSLVDESRVLNSYTLPLAKHKNFLKTGNFAHRWYGNNLLKLPYKTRNKWDSTRYFGANFHSIYFRKTIEFRYHHGTLNADEIIDWCNFLLHIIEWCDSDRYNKKTLDLIAAIPEPKTKLNTLLNVISVDSKLKERLVKKMKVRNVSKYKEFLKEESLWY